MNPLTAPLYAALESRVAADPRLAGRDWSGLVRPAIRLGTERIPGGLLEPGESRIGGRPDVPPGFDWPRWSPAPRKNKFGEPWSPSVPMPMGFVAQFDLAALPDIDDGLPNSGWLYFFYDRYCETWGFDPADRGSCRVIYLDGDRSTLARTKPPADADPEHTAEACRVEAWHELNLPDEIDDVKYGTPEYEAYRELCEELLRAGGHRQHRLQGHPRLIQNPMELECQLASNGVYCGGPEGYRSEEAERLRAGAADWRLLLQIDTDEEGPGWMWGDVGSIYFWIRKQDLALRNFENVWLVFQCC
jgi:uncharacterized protein YwqG